MKLYPLLPALFLFAACSQTPALTPEQQAVSAYLKQNANDPASYEAVRWGTSAALRQQDADKMAADTLIPKYELAKIDAERLAMKWAASNAKGHSTAASWKQMLTEADTLQMRLYAKIYKAKNSQDTTRIGTVVSHTFRGKNKLGALVLDSARFAVLKSGKVMPL